MMFNNRFKFVSVSTYFQGRHTMFVVFFALSGLVLAAFGKLSDSYVHLCTALQTAVLVHSTQENYFQKNPGSGDIK